MERETVDEMVSLYQELKNLKLVGEEMNIPWQTVYWWLKKEGVSVSGNKSLYGGFKDQIGLIGERLFRKAFPEAEDQNDKSFQPQFDFFLDGLKLDVKTSFPRDMKCRNSSTVKYRWGFNTRRQQEADFIVGYCMSGNLEDWKLEHIMLIPNEFLQDIQTISISCDQRTRSKWMDFKVEENELIEFLNSIKQIN